MTKKRFYLSFDKDVSYWNNEKGAGVKADGETDLSRWSVQVDLDTHILATDETFAERLKYHIENVAYLTFDYFIIFEDGRLTGSTVENNDSSSLSIEEQEHYHARKEQMYLADYNCYIKIEEVVGEYREPTVDELKKLIPMLQTY